MSTRFWERIVNEIVDSVIVFSQSTALNDWKWKMPDWNSWCVCAIQNIGTYGGKSHSHFNGKENFRLRFYQFETMEIVLVSFRRQTNMRNSMRRLTYFHGNGRWVGRWCYYVSFSYFQAKHGVAAWGNQATEKHKHRKRRIRFLRTHKDKVKRKIGWKIHQKLGDRNRTSRSIIFYSTMIIFLSIMVVCQLITCVHMLKMCK